MIEHGLPYVLSVFTIAQMWLAGSVSRWTWIVALCAQVVWFFWIIYVEQWGLMLGNVVLTCVFVRNQYRWMYMDRFTSGGDRQPMDRHTWRG